MSVNFDRLVDFIEAEISHKGRAENKDFPEEIVGQNGYAFIWGLWDVGHIFLLNHTPFMLKSLPFFSF